MSDKGHVCTINIKKTLIFCKEANLAALLHERFKFVQRYTGEVSDLHENTTRETCEQ